MVGLILGAIAVVAVVVLGMIAYHKPGPDQNEGIPPTAKEGEAW